VSAPKILVAIDVSEGKVVRLTRGEMAEKTIYHNDPVATAQEWEAQGAEWLHVVDLDAAMGRGGNAAVIAQAIANVSVPVEVGGGVRSLEAISDWVQAGASRVVIGTRALEPEFLSSAIKEFGDRLVASVDVSEGRVRLQGWTSASAMTAAHAVSALENAGVSRIIFTDVSRDGTLQGADVKLIEDVVKHTSVPVIAGGGVATEDDIAKLAPLAASGLEGIIVGKAFYSGSLTLGAAKLAAAAAGAAPAPAPAPEGD
jgi:phosphoribosylformimino-5-aminoimidazole carboxamide ribotide isomerase